MKRYFPYFLVLLLGLIVFPGQVAGQSNLAAVLEVREAGVEVRRVDTEQFIPVSVEAIVGVGDVIRTDGTGRANIIFFADGTETELEPDTEYRIDAFEGDADAFTLSVTVLAGQTTQRLNRLLDDNSSYDVTTPGMQMVARGTVFRIRVEASGRAAMLVDEGVVDANADAETAAVDVGFGIRSAPDDILSDVVAATDFAALDAALDGCDASLAAPDDVRLNVRLGPSTDFPRVGTIEEADINILIGTVPGTGWYRIDFRDGFGWILSSNADIGAGCAGLREFPADHGPEDASLYSSIGDEISIDDLDVDLTPTPDPAEDTDDADSATDGG